MRLSSLAIATCLVTAGGCSKKESKSETQPEPKVTEQKPAVKKPVDTKPLPPLAADPGGATGKPVRGTGFGGLGIDAPRGLVIDSDGSAYVAGHFEGEATFGELGKRTAETTDPNKKTSDAYVVRVGPDGKLVWAQTFGAKRDDTANAIAIRGDQVLVVGNFLDEIKLGDFTKKSVGSDDAFVVAYDKKGEVQWAWNFGGIDSDGANAIAATPDGGWVVGGSFSGTADFGTSSYKTRGGTDAMLVKLKAGGELEWVKQFGGAYPDTIMHVSVDGQGNIIVQGVFKDVADWGGDKLKAGGGSDNDVVLAKYDLNGDHLWSQRFGNAFNEVAGGLTVDPAGFITMVGSFDKSISFGKSDDHASSGESDIFVVRFDGKGQLQWARTFGADREDIASGVATDASGNTVTTGWFQQSIDFGTGTLTSKGNKDIFALKLDVNGAIVWSQRFGDKDHDQGRAIAIDDKGAAFVAGIYRFQLDAVSPPLESVREPTDRIPKPDTFVVKLER